MVGNCGASAAPRVGRYPMPSDWRDKKYPGPWNTVTEYRELLDQVKPAVNVVLLIGHNAIRAGIMGYEGRAATDSEFKAMADLLAKSLDEGGAGLSTGLIYSPGMFAPPEEIIGLAKIVARRGKIYTSHMRSEGAKLLEAIDETIDIGRQSGVRVQISHLKTSGRKNWHLIDAALDKIRKAQAEGVEVASDRYPYTAACTDLDVILPDWASEGGREAVLKRLRDPQTRKRIRDDLAASRDAQYWESVTVGTTHHPDNRKFQGVPLLQVAKQLSMDPVDAVLHLIDTDELHTGGIFFGMSEANMWKILGEPYVMIGSDASVRAPEGPLSHDHPHPRAYGDVPALPARRAGWKDRSASRGSPENDLASGGAIPAERPRHPRDGKAGRCRRVRSGRSSGYGHLREAASVRERDRPRCGERRGHSPGRPADGPEGGTISAIETRKRRDLSCRCPWCEAERLALGIWSCSPPDLVFQLAVNVPSFHLAR